MPPLLLEQLTIKGEIYALPIDVHRSNVLWYNPKLFAGIHRTPPSTFDEFFQVGEELQAQGITPLAFGCAEGFEAPQLFESVLLATYGPDDYVRLVQGDHTLWADARLATAITTLKRMLHYTNANCSAWGWVDAAQMVLDGKAGMTIMGDWVDGYYLSKSAVPDKDYGWAAAPGNDGMFLWLSDSFAIPKGAPHRDAALAWLRTAGTRQGQDAFNPLKGSIPARTDPDQSLYDAYLRWSIDQFRADQLAPSIVHGAAAPQTFTSLFNRALINFSQDLDEQALADALRAASAQLNP
jgi:glucose/mannose transport system substrate-binding protein